MSVMSVRSCLSVRRICWSQLELRGQSHPVELVGDREVVERAGNRVGVRG